MALSFSDVGLGGAATATSKRNEEDDRRLRMHKILKSIGRPTGRVSEDSIARLSRRLGLTNDIDVEKLTPMELERVVGNRSNHIGGNKILVEVALKAQVPERVEVTFDTENEGLETLAAPAGEILLRDLRATDDGGVTSNLDRFATNLEYLARIDRLSSNQLNCFEALSGVYSSLRRSYIEERKTYGEAEIVRRRSGKPTAHEGRKLGISTEYWRPATHVTASESADTIMHNDDSHSNPPIEDVEEKGVYRLLLEVEPSSAALYPPLRVSDHWLDLQTTGMPDSIPWQEPPPTYTSSPANSSIIDAMAIDTGIPLLPDVRFVARLSPPVILPWQIASSILQSCGVSVPQIFVAPPSWLSLLTGQAAGPYTAVQQVLSPGHDGENGDVVHHYTFDAAKPQDWAYKLTDLPFSHPRQLVEALPVLRQWACFGELVQGVLSPSQDLAHDGASTAPLSLALSLSELLTPPPTPPESAERATIPIDITLTTTPVPMLSISVPTSGSNAANSKVFNVRTLLNGEVVVSTQGSVESEKKAAKALEACGDLGLWVEWLRTSVANV